MNKLRPWIIWLITLLSAGVLSFAPLSPSDELEIGDLPQYTRISRDKSEEEQSWLIVFENTLVHFEGNNLDLQQLDSELLRSKWERLSVLESSPDLNRYKFVDWGDYYPMNRGQGNDPSSGKSQRTYNRWSKENLWYFGQSTWRYQDPSGGSAPPATFPKSFNEQMTKYFYNYQCDPDINPDVYQDCINWQIYIEIMSEFDDPSLLGNWTTGGWKSLSARPPEWTVFYSVDAFDGVCEGDYIRKYFSNEDLGNPENKTPLLFRLPSTKGVTYTGYEVCAITFNGFEQNIGDIQSAETWRVTTTMHDLYYDLKNNHSVILAENRYYTYHSTIRAKSIYRLWGRELYWMEQVDSADRLSGGFEKYWWYTWELPPEANADVDHDTTWSNYQWCHLDLLSGPAGLGTLICEDDV